MHNSPRPSPRQILETFTFDQLKTDVKGLLQTTASMFGDASSSMSMETAAHQQLLFVILDGAILDERERCKKLVREAAERGQTCVLIMIDHPKLEGDQNESSVFKIKVCGWPRSHVTMHVLCISCVSITVMSLPLPGAVSQFRGQLLVMS